MAEMFNSCDNLVNLNLSGFDTRNVTTMYKMFNACDKISKKVKSIIVDKLGVDESEVKNEASFANDLGADSLDTVELIMEFEKEFSIQIPDDQAEKISTVGDAIAYIKNNVKQ
jgi:acyl carrier protein